jgi:apolipoprotein D and lipocalin family protein
MNPMRRLCAAAWLLALAACTTPPEGPVPATVGSVDIQRYAGTWYEIARYENRFQDGSGRRCEATTATYTPSPDGTVAVVNRCRDDGANGLPRVAEGWARPANAENSKLRVTFFWPFFGDYWVIGLDPDYRWAVVGSPGRDYLWILSRTPVLEQPDYGRALDAARSQGFDVMRLRVTDQGTT